MKKLMVSSAMILGLMGVTQAYAGGEIFDPSVSSCSFADCSSVRIDATILTSPGNATRWVAEVYSTAGQCLRVFVSSQYADLETVVVAPNGTVFRNDDGGGALRPLVKVNSAPNTGWYTVSIGRFAGQVDTGNLTVLYGRYLLNNINCSVPTPPILSSNAGKR